MCQFADPICRFYIEQSQADNHAVREAACHCISELATKVAAEIDREPIKPHVPSLLDTLVNCFKDQSWPVRDAACIACGHFVGIFPEEAKAVYEELKPLWLAHLSDNINSVREHSAMALCQVIKPFEEDLMPVLKKYLDENLLKVKEQKSNSEKFSDLEETT